MYKYSVLPAHLHFAISLSWNLLVLRHRILRQNGIWWNGTHQISAVLLQLYFLGECNEPARFMTVLLDNRRCCTLHYFAYILSSLRLLVVYWWLYISTSWKNIVLSISKHHVSYLSEWQIVNSNFWGRKESKGWSTWIVLHRAHFDQRLSTNN